MDAYLNKTEDRERIESHGYGAHPEAREPEVEQQEVHNAEMRMDAIGALEERYGDGYQALRRYACDPDIVVM
jgi:hypothetical protein